MTLSALLRSTALVAAGALAGLPSLAQAQSAPSPYTFATRYDAAGRATGTIAPDPDGAGPLGFAATRTTYDAAGRPIKVEEGSLTGWQGQDIAPASWSGFTAYRTTLTTYDQLDRKLTTKVLGADLAAAALTQFSYDTVGRLECTAVRMNPAAFGALPVSACNLGTEGTQGPDRVTKNVYDAVGQLIQVRKAVGTSVENVDATYSYTANGKQQYVIDANGNRAQYIYDGFDRQIQWVFPSSVRPGAFSPATQATALLTAGSANAADYEQYGYDANGNRTSLRKRDGSVLSYSYDALNRVVSKVVPERAGLAPTHTRDLFYGYDLLGRQLYARYDSAAGQGLSSTWDGLGRLIGSTLIMDTSWVIGHTYDANGNTTSTTFPDGQFVTYAYDGLDRPTQIRRSGTAAIASYAYNDAGQRISFNGGVNTSYGYDAAGRVASLTNNPAANATANNAWTFAYNPASQITTLTRSNDAFAFAGLYNVNRSYTANGLNQYTGAGSVNFGYDANGNLTSDGATTFGYDVENRLVSASGGKNAALRYDPLGHLYEVGGATGTTRLVWDGDALLAEYDTAGNLLRRYVHGADVQADDPVAWYEGSAFAATNERILRSDWQGSVALVTDSAGSATLAINTYDEWGIPGTSNQGRFQYTGQAWIPELGLYHYKARFYSPTLGRFLQVDPIGYKDQINLYGYVANDPVNKTDPTGLQSVQDQQLQAQIEDMRAQGIPEREIIRQIGQQAKTEGMALSMLIAPEGALVARFGVAAVRLARVAEGFVPAATRAAAVERLSFAKSALGTIQSGAGKVIATATGEGASKGAVFRDAGAFAKKFGGEASDYVKVSVTSVTESGERVSIHAVRNIETGKIYDPKLLIGR